MDDQGRPRGLAHRCHRLMADRPRSPGFKTQNEKGEREIEYYLERRENEGLFKVANPSWPRSFSHIYIYERERVKKLFCPSLEREKVYSALI